MMDSFPFKGEITKWCAPGIHMSMLGQDNELAYNVTPCKEYCLDYTQYTINGTGSSPYVKSYKPVCVNEVRLVVDNMTNVLNSLDFVTQFEKAIDYPLSTVNRLTESAVVFRGSKRWFIAPPMLSLYTLLVRSGQKHVLGKSFMETLTGYWKGDFPSGQDSFCHKFSRAGVELILKHKPEPIFGIDLKKNWPPGFDIHDRGIVSFTQNAIKINYPLRRNHPDWYKLWQPMETK